MPRKKRLQVSLSDDMWKTLDRFAASTGLSPASFAASILEESQGVFEALSNIYIKAKTGSQASLVKEMGDLIDGAMLDAAQIKLELDRDQHKRKTRRQVKRVK